MQWQDATRPDIGYQGMMPGRSDITVGESTTLDEAGFGIGAMRESLEQTVEEVSNLGVVVTDYGNLLERKVEPWAVPTVAPLSQTINRRADPTFQLSDFMVPPMRGRSDTEGHNHTHITTTVAHQLQQGGNTKNRAYLAFLTPSINRAYSQLNFMVSEVTSPCQMDVGIYLVDPETKVLTRQVYQTDVGIPLGEAVAIVEFDQWVAPQGSYIAIVWLQRGTGNTRSLLGLDDTPRPLLNNVFPRKISAIHTSASVNALPAAIDGESLVDFEGYWFTPYAELSEDVGADYRVFNESWPDTGAAGRPWVPLTSPGIRSAGGYTSAGGLGTRVSVYETQLSTDYVRVQSTINRTFDNTRRSTLIVRGSNDLRSGVGVSAVNNTHYELIEWNNRDAGSSWHDRTVHRTFGATPRAGDQIEVDYLNGLVDVRINGVHHVAAQAVGGPQGAAARFLGVQNERTGSIINAFPSPWFGPWSARDLPQADDGENDEDGTGTEG